jgi:hemerythrin superfamily protein
MATIRQSDEDEMMASQATDSGALDAIELLRADHDDVRQLFEDYESLIDDDAAVDERQALASRICEALTVHATIEEEIFYPAAREAIDDTRLLDEAAVEHSSARDLIEQIESMTAADDLFDAKVKVLGEYVQHHVLEEEDELFALIADTDLDLEELGQQLAERRQELLADIGIEEE